MVTQISFVVGVGLGKDAECCGFGGSHLVRVSPIVLRTGVVLRWNKFICSRKLYLWGNCIYAKYPVETIMAKKFHSLVTPS